MNTRTTDHGFDNQTTQADRARILREADRAINTRAAISAVLDPSLGGRFAKEAKADFTVGRDPVVSYPRLPANGPWGAGPQVGEEPPFPEDISYVPPCGEPHEAEAATRLLLSVEAAEVFSSLGTEAGSQLPPPATAADPLPPLLSGSATSAPTISALAPGVVGADPPLAGQSSSDSSDQPLAASHLPPADGSSPFFNSAPPSIADHAPNEGGVTSRVSKAGSLHRRFG